MSQVSTLANALDEWATCAVRDPNGDRVVYAGEEYERDLRAAATLMREQAAEIERLRTVIRVGGAMLRAEVAALGGPLLVEVDRDPNRCAVCGWKLAASREDGCVRGDCSMRPRPAVLYDEERAAAEAKRG